MSLRKGIEHGKEKRKPYYGSKNFDYSCRNHGGCDYCENNRKHFDKKKRSSAEKDLKDFFKDGV